MSIPFTNTIGPQVTPSNQTSKPLVLNEGQMIHGKVNQLFPGQLAEVQVGNQKMVAKMEVPMRAGDSYYFQVTSVSPEVQLKIISGPTNAQTDSTQQLNHLMQAMQLPKTAEMTKLLSFVIENKIPITREGLLQAVKLLQTTPAAHQQEALVSIQKILDLKLPLTENIFRAIFGVETKEGLHSLIQSLTTALQNDSSAPSQMRASILQMLTQLENPVANITSNAVLGESLKALIDQKETPELRFSVLQLLKEPGILPPRASLPNIQSLLTSVVLERAGLPPTTQGSLSPAQLENLAQFVSTLSFLSSGQQESLLTTARSSGMQPFVNALLQMVGGNLASQPGQIDSQSQQRILSLLNIENSPEQAISRGPVQVNVQSQQAGMPLSTVESSLGNNQQMTMLLQNAEKTEHAMIRNLVQLAESTVATEIDGKMMKDTMQSIFRSLGMNYESALLGKNTQPDQLAQMLKPQLLAMLNDASIAENVRNAAEQFVVRMNGSPLLSTENGVNHQLIMQIPLEFFGKKIDATLQWNGRMKEDKKIDADFARILFYLNLHSLDETVVDMQVQNRIVTVTVFNADTALQQIAHPLQDKLKEGLSSHGYTLSGVFFKGFLEAEKQVVPKNTATVSEGGVDFRI